MCDVGAPMTGGGGVTVPRARLGVSQTTQEGGVDVEQNAPLPEARRALATPTIGSQGAAGSGTACGAANAPPGSYAALAACSRAKLAAP